MTKQPLNKLIFVDDDEDLLKIAQYCLEDLSGTTIKYLRSGEATIQEALIFKPDLILMDVMMPKMDGIATVNAMRLLPTLAEIPVVFITAKVQKEELNHYYKLGILDVIIKPFDPLTLADTVRAIWNKHTDEK